MLKYLIEKNGQPRVEQWTVAPAVYFDHWALRVISQDAGLRLRFTSALSAKNGTLMLSWLNLVEFINVSDISQGRAAEDLIEELLPNLFFFEVNPFTVMEAEDKLLAGAEPFPPHADTGFLRAFIALKPKPPCPFTARNLFTIVQKSELSSGSAALADTVVERVEAMRSIFLTDAGFKAQVRKLPARRDIQHGTRYVLRELVRPMLMDQETKLTRNHAFDLIHAVVPVAYCDIVLLDKHWQVQVEKMRVRFAEVGMPFPIARVFSRKSNGLDEFLSLLESDA